MATKAAQEGEESEFGMCIWGSNSARKRTHMDTQAHLVHARHAVMPPMKKRATVINFPVPLSSHYSVNRHKPRITVSRVVMYMRHCGGNTLEWLMGFFILSLFFFHHYFAAKYLHFASALILPSPLPIPLCFMEL